MRTGTPESDLIVKWHLLSKEASNSLTRGLDRNNKKFYKPQHLLGLRGQYTEAALKVINNVYAYTLNAPEDDEVPTVRTSHELYAVAGRAPLSMLLQYPGLGERFDVMVFMRHKSASQDLYNDALEATIGKANRLLAIKQLPQIPTYRQFQYPLDKFQF